MSVKIVDHQEYWREKKGWFQNRFKLDQIALPPTQPYPVPSKLWTQNGYEHNPYHLQIQSAYEHKMDT